MEQSRFRSWVAWTAVCAQVIALLVAFGVVDIGQGDAVREVTASVLQLLVVFGVLNNPTDRDGF
jgi:uncharacterized membrane protein